MKYRFLGNSGLLVSAFSFGALTFNDESKIDDAYEILTHAYKHGINFWDTAEQYTNGVSEVVLGKVLQRGVENGVWTREDIVISTKLFFGTKEGPNAGGISRKHLIEGIKAALKRLGTDYVDVLYAHRPENETPIEETVRAMDFIINQGWAFYWGTSNWLESEILEANAVADRLGLIRPIAEQAQYNLFSRTAVEVEFKSLYDKYKYGVTAWSPLAFGILTGKYANGTPTDSRLAVPWVANFMGDISSKVALVEKLRPTAEELECSVAQLALAWCASNPNVSSVILGAKTIKQLEENLAAFPIAEKITPEIKNKIEAAIPFTYKASEHDFMCALRHKYFK